MTYVFLQQRHGGFGLLHMLLHWLLSPSRLLARTGNLVPRRRCSACRAAAQASERRSDDSASPYFQYGDSHCCEVSFGFRLPRHRPCRIFYNARALERVLLPSARPTNLCRAPPCCFPLLLLQPHRASLSSFSRRATCESRRRALSRSTPPASRWQPLPPRFMPALPPHARAAVLARARQLNAVPPRRRVGRE